MKLIKYLLKLKAPRIVYVSCNPATCARDLDYLCHGVVCITFFPRALTSLILSRLKKSKILCAGREKYKRVLQTKEFTASGHVPTHSSYRMCKSIGDLR